MKVLVAGGAGFIGSNFVRMFLKGEFPRIQQIKVLDALNYAGNKMNFSERETKEFEFIHGDIRDQNLVGKTLRNLDSVINFAAESHVDRSISSPIEFTSTNTLGAHQLFQSALENSINNFLQVSTDEVYGSISEGSFSEDDLLNPNSPYSASKAASDLIALSYHRTFDFPIKVTRASNNYGPFQFPEKIIPLFVTNLLQNKKIPIYGDGSNIRDWLHVDDHCRALYQVMLQGEAGQIYNIGGGNEISNLDLTMKIIKILGISEDVIEYVNDRPGHDLRYSVDCTKIKNKTGFAPEKSFDLNLETTIRWYQDNTTWWQKAIKLKA
jgi:dTDP-glucose 4,6-dehydratase